MEEAEKSSQSTPDQWVTVAVFSWPSEVIVPQGLLGSEGIETFIKDEFTAQVHNFYANAIGGIKLQVPQSQYEKAAAILYEHGFITKDPFVPQPNKVGNFLFKVDKVTGKIPLLNKLNFIPRVLLLLFIPAVLLGLLINILIEPSLQERLESSEWCVEEFKFNGESYGFRTTGFHLYVVGSEYCENRMELHRDEIYFPGINSPIIRGKWSLNDDILIIQDVDTFDFVFEGEYKCSIRGNKLYLQSDNTYLKAKQIRKW